MAPRDAVFSRMVDDLRKLIAKRPFVPFTIHTVDGGAMHVPTGDHIHVTPTGNRVFVDFDDGSYDTIRPLMISRLTVEARPNGSAGQGTPDDRAGR
jgi:hypothetical protein